MFPGYRYVDPYYQTCPQREPNSYACQYYPTWDHVTPHMKADPSKQPPVFMPRPFNSNMCHPYPGDHGGCCHHSCSPGCFNLRPPFSPPQPYFYGPYPGPYPGYFIPPPHYSVDQAQYDYDKARDHCCGCPNHKCHRGDEKLPRIEEQKPEKTQDGESTGLIRLPNYPSPVVWVPANSIKDKEGDKRAELKPGYWNGWVPLDINNLKGSREEEEGKEVQQVDDKSAQTRSPFPIIWLPGYKKPEEERKDLKEITQKSAEDCPAKFKIVPLKLLENEDHGERPSRVVQEDPEPENQVEKEAPVEKQTKIKMIPVNQVEYTSQKKTGVPEKEGGKVDQNKATIHEKNKYESDVDKASEKKQSAPEKKKSSPVRSLKLPPVCLRVDPLPRKTRTNGTSRSPSLPGHKDKRDCQKNEEQSPRIERKEEIFEKVIPVVNVKDNTLSRAGKGQKFQGSVPVAPMEVSSNESQLHETAEELTEGSRPVEKDSEEKKPAEAESEQKIELNEGLEEPSENKEVKEKKEAKRDLSQTDAAVIIQSTYRGFVVRRWHPLEKLRKIAKIREQVNNVKRQVESIKASQKELDARQRMVMGETILNLLLQLDTVQGLHPSVREERKTVARELTSLQDKLDTLHNRIAEEHGSAKVEEEETKATMDSAAAFASSSADATEKSFKQDSPVGQIDTASAKTTEGPAREETKHTTDGAAVFVSFSSDTTEEPSDTTEEPLKQDSLEGKIDNASVEATEGPAQADVNLIDSSCADEVISVTGPSLPSESTHEQEPMLPTEDGTTKDQTSFGSDDETAIAASPSIAASVSEQCVNQSEPTCEKDILENLKENSASENPSLQCKERESKFGGITVGAEATEIDKSTELPGNDGSCNGDESTDTLICNEEDSKLSSEDAGLGLDEKGLLEPSKEVEYQEHEAAPNDLDDHGADGCAIVLGGAEGLQQEVDVGEHVIAKEIESELKSEKKEETHDRQEEIFLSPPGDESDGINISIPVENVDDACNKDVSCPELAIEADDALPEKEDEIISQDNLKSEKTDDANDNRSEACGEKIEGTIRDMHLPVVKDAMNEFCNSPAAEQELHVSVDNSSSSSSTDPADPRGEEVKVANQVNADVAVDETGRRLIEENEKLKKMLSELLEAGKEQLGVITNLNGRVQDLERKLAQKKKRAIKVKRNKPVQLPSCDVSS